MQKMWLEVTHCSAAGGNANGHMTHCQNCGLNKQTKGHTDCKKCGAKIDGKRGEVSRICSSCTA
eukprot:6058166-Amphidinium_carterae.1